MSDQEQDVVAVPYQPTPEIAELISNLKLILQGKEVDVNDTVYAVIQILEKGEPFHEGPHPDSGQGKWKQIAIDNVKTGDRWHETAMQESRNREFYQGIVTKIGKIIGEEAYTSDDGSIQDTVLALKVPQLVNKLKEEVKRKENWLDPDLF